MVPAIQSASESFAGVNVADGQYIHRPVQPPGRRQDRSDRNRKFLQAFTQLMQLPFVRHADAAGLAHRFLKLGLTPQQAERF
jgi:hypothetical protein